MRETGGWLKKIFWGELFVLIWVPLSSLSMTLSALSEFPKVGQAILNFGDPFFFRIYWLLRVISVYEFS